MPDLRAQWPEIKRKLKEEFNISDIAYKSFINPLEIKRISDDSIFIVIPFEKDNSIDIDYYNRKYMQIIQVAIAESTGGKEYEIYFINRSSKDETSNSDNNNEEKETAVKNRSENAAYSSSLNVENTFENFVVGKNSELAHSAALAVADNPGYAYNPLFLYGGPGVGKTHLMQAIGNYIRSRKPNTKVLYVTSEQFINELVNSIKINNPASFREKYRNIDVLLIDDIQFIQNKGGTQEEVFHTFNELHAANKQIVITSDKTPRELKILEERLRSRFEEGIMADISSPDYETRAAIVRQIFEKKKMTANDDIIDYLASNIKSNIRELTGATNKLDLISKNRELTLDLVKDNIGEYISDNTSHKITMENIVDEVCKYYSVTRDDINSSKRSKEIAHPRQVATYLCRILTDNSQEIIGKTIGNRDHSTVINSFNRITEEITNNTRTAEEVEEIRSRLQER